MPPAVSVDPAGFSGQWEAQYPANSTHVGRRLRRDRKTQFGPRVAQDQALTGGESGADSLYRHPLILLKPSPAGQMAHAGERNAGNGDVRLHPLGLPVERQPYLEVALRDLGDIFDTAIIQKINFASCGEGQ